jgi:hypothetical protein
MSRSGYVDDGDCESYPNACWLYQQGVQRALQGQRGQAFLRRMIAALDAMPSKRLIENEVVDVASGEVCAMGAVAVAEGIDMSGVDPDDARAVARRFGIAQSMAREIAFMNDENDWKCTDETPEERWQRMRDWAAKQIIEWGVA